LFVALMDHPGFRQLDFSALKVTNSGGTALVKATAERWESLTGCRIVEGYGLTETSPVASTNPYGQLARLGTVGIPVAGTAFKVIDDEGNELPLGERGELCIKGPQVMKGYWQQPEATAQTLDAQGWLKTGDIAVIDDSGFHRIVGRESVDMIKSGGYRIGAGEVEQALLAYPGVREAAVVGMPDDDLGQRIVAFIVGDVSDCAVVSDFVAESLSIHKRPRQVCLVDSLPRNAMGKVQKKLLTL